MSADVDISIELIESLDFEVVCDYTEECAARAEWLQDAHHRRDGERCHTFLLCPAHYEHVKRFVEAPGDNACNIHWQLLDVAFVPLARDGS